MNGKPANIALYWDFENMHASVLNNERGQDYYFHQKYRKQDEVLDVGAIMDYANSLGAVNINKAFANWSFLHAYSFSLQENAVDLIQLFPKGSHGKNGADIRMSIEVIEDLVTNPHIDMVVIVGGDSDYISVAQKVRSKGKRIIGIGVKETTNGYWVKSCNEFKFYSTLLQRSSVSPVPARAEEEEEGPDFEEAKALLVKAVSHLISESGNQAVVRAAIKPLMLRLDPAFDESDVGCNSFTEFLKRCSDVITLTDANGDCWITLGERKEGAPPAIPLRALHPYENILKKQQIRLPEPGFIETACEATVAIFSEHDSVASYDEFRDLLAARFPELPATEITKMKAILYKLRAFELIDGEAEGAKRVRLCDSLRDVDHLKRACLAFLIARIADNVFEENLDFTMIAELLLGNRDGADEMEDLFRKSEESPQAQP